MNGKVKKRIIKVTMGLVISISLISSIGFFIHIKENYQVISTSKECKNDIRNLQEEYIEVMYKKILNEDTSKTLGENLDYYNEILSNSDSIKSKIEDIYAALQENKIQDSNLYGYLDSAKTFLVSIDKVYNLFKEGAEGNFTNLNNLSEEEAQAMVKRIKSSYNTLVMDYKNLKLNNKKVNELQKEI